MSGSSGPTLRRRRYVSLLGVAAAGLAGCSSESVPSGDGGLSGDNELGDSESRDDLEVTVEDAETIDELQFRFNGSDAGTMTAPDTGALYIAEVSVTNNDIETRTGPQFNIRDYQKTSLEDYESEEQRNDILFYSGEEKGAIELPGNVYTTGYERLRADGEEITPYPAGMVSGPDIEADSTVSGWVFGLVEAESDARLMVHWADQSSYWAVSE